MKLKRSNFDFPLISPSHFSLIFQLKSKIQELPLKEQRLKLIARTSSSGRKLFPELDFLYFFDYNRIVFLNGIDLLFRCFAAVRTFLS